MLYFSFFGTGSREQYKWLQVSSTPTVEYWGKHRAYLHVSIPDIRRSGLGPVGVYLRELKALSEEIESAGIAFGMKFRITSESYEKRNVKDHDLSKVVVDEYESQCVFNFVDRFQLSFVATMIAEKFSRYYKGNTPFYKSLENCYVAPRFAFGGLYISSIDAGMEEYKEHRQVEKMDSYCSSFQKLGFKLFEA